MKRIWQNQHVFNQITEAVNARQTPLHITGSDGPGIASFLAELFHETKRAMFVVVPDLEDSVALVKDLRFFMAPEGQEILTENSRKTEPVWREDSSGPIILLPEFDPNIDQTSDAAQTFKTRVNASMHVLANHCETIAIAPASFLATRLQDKRSYYQSGISVHAGDDLDLRQLIESLTALGYLRVPRVESEGEFSFRGGILDVYVPVYSLPVRLEFFGNEVVSIREFDALTQRSISRVSRVDFISVSQLDGGTIHRPFLKQIPEWFGQELLTVWIQPDRILNRLAETDREVAEEASRESFPGNPAIHWDIIEDAALAYSRQFIVQVTSIQPFDGDYKGMVQKLSEWLERGFRIRIVYHRESVRQVLESRLAEAELEFTERKQTIHSAMPRFQRVESKPVFVPGKLSKGFILPESGWIFLSESDIVGSKKIQKWRPPTGIEPGFSFQDLQPGDLVVHVDHGIGRYHGLHRLTINGRIRDFLLILYAEDQKLYLPVDRLNLIQRYMTVKGAEPTLDRLGGVTFDKRKSRVKESVLKLAAELLKLFSARQVISGYAYPSDEGWQREFDLGFEYEETPDQMKAILDVRADMEKAAPMDRIVCGDVGYGKTEVAMRAAFKAAINGKQVAVLVPTTILAQQHFLSFRKRFKSFPIQIAMLSRFLRDQDKKNVKTGLAKGTVDIVIGTHALLADSIKFKDLGLVVIDEEQRFGVQHKEKLKQMRTKVDVLTLTATPIPRTLNMALLGLREISIINTPPEARLSIKTSVVKFNRQVIREAILSELSRGGQIFFVHNRVLSIYGIADMLKNLIPEARFEVAHGQMAESSLENIMMRFLEKEFDVLISTTIIESGLDIPSVNTIIINRADRLGLAQLYQLRGRVGRDRFQAYAYLLIPASTTLSPKARERLSAIKDAVELGSGFKLATRDLDIRGAGDIIGPNQHGQITAVGFEMYCKLIRDAVRELKGEMLEQLPECEIKLPYDLAIPESYISEPANRLEVYRRFSSFIQEDDLQYYMQEIQDLYGDIPPELQTLKHLALLRIVSRRMHLELVEYTPHFIRIVFRDSTPLKPEIIMSMLLQSKERLRFDPPSTLKILLHPNSQNDILSLTGTVLNEMARHI